MLLMEDTSGKFLYPQLAPNWETTPLGGEGAGWASLLHLSTEGQSGSHLGRLHPSLLAPALLLSDGGDSIHWTP